MEESSHSNKLDDYHILELKEIFARTKALSGHRLQLFSFFGTLNLTVVGLAIEFEEQRSFLLILGGCILILLLIFDGFVRHQMYALYSRGLILEQKYCPENLEGTIMALTKAALSKSEMNKLTHQMEKEPRQADLIKFLKSCYSSRFGILAPSVIMIIQILIGIGLIPI